jgi:metacaspase-1
MQALLIGINYIGTRNELRGCINDVMNISQFLTTRFGFSHDDIVILRDDRPPNPAMYPTKANMIRAMHWLVDNARPHDSLFFHYSGHGGQMLDFNSVQDDVFDETIYPADFDKAGAIVNTVFAPPFLTCISNYKEMHDIMVTRLPPGCRLTAIFDCCHSGSALSLPYEYVSSYLIGHSLTSRGQMGS